ncbi:uncharacterized protein LOC127003836 [Eriocheir sinensis]|uniref:uncharacterized protein LOC127003836 n=1 Tax=Eriocheir sinensis TaxID=95602 RepID=UPI0021C8970C|nr:uncharacterized protein LOC127003836 [Eriocheir sinensis]
MSGQGKGASHGDLSDAGYTSAGITKGSVGSNMMSQSDVSGHGKPVVSSLQSAGARGQDFSGSNLSRGALNDSGLTSQGVTRGSAGAHMMSNVDKSGAGGGVKSSLQSVGAKK